MSKLTQFELRMIDQYLAENWDEFGRFCEAQGMDFGDIEILADKLTKEADK